jgi:ribonucleoside-diphosphate reductase alpha chain
MLSWKLALKACALYRDGSKLSQPLSNKSDKKTTDKKDDEKATSTPEVKEQIKQIQLTAEQVLEAARDIINNSHDTKFKRQLSTIVERKTLPSKRMGFTQKAKIGGQTIFVRTGEYDDGTLGEIFVDMHKEGASLRSMINCFAIAVSIGLQYGVPLEEYVDKFIFTRFEPSGMVDHDNIKNATSIVDYVFRLLGYEYLNRQDLVHVLPAPKPEVEDSHSGHDHGHSHDTKKTEQAKKAQIKLETGGAKDQTQEYLSSMMGDAPSCNVCGHITVRSGTCYKCLNCGNSMGCS